MECWQRLNFIIKGRQDIGKENIPDYAGAKELFLPVTGTEGTVMSLIVHLHLVLLWRNVFVTLEKFDKVTAVIETTVISNASNGRISGAEHGAGSFNTVVV